MKLTNNKYRTQQCFYNNFLANRLTNGWIKKRVKQVPIPASFRNFIRKRSRQYSRAIQRVYFQFHSIQRNNPWCSFSEQLYSVLLHVKLWFLVFLQGWRLHTLPGWLLEWMCQWTKLQFKRRSQMWKIYEF